MTLIVPVSEEPMTEPTLVLSASSINTYLLDDRSLDDLEDEPEGGDAMTSTGEPTLVLSASSVNTYLRCGRQ